MSPPIPKPKISDDDPANLAALARFAELDPEKIALLLDVDGTLIDIGPSPFEVDVSDALKETLAALHRRSGGALALVSGRPVRDLDLLFTPLRLPAVGGHGAEMRLAQAQAATRIADLPEGLRRRLIDAVTPGSGLEYEDKGYSVALHYRKAPHEAERLRRHISASRAAFPDEATELLLGKAMFEVKRPGINKGDGIRALMKLAPFAGRVPVFIGDDVTDDAAFAMLHEFGGKGFSVRRNFPGLSGIFSSPGQVRRALMELAADT